MTYIDDNPGHTLWRKYGLSNIGKDPCAETAHWMVCLYLERHPDKQAEYFRYRDAWTGYYKDSVHQSLPDSSNRYGYFAALKDAEAEMKQ